MSATLYKFKLYDRVLENPVHVLFVGAALEKASSIFRRKDEAVRCDHVMTPSDAMDKIVEQSKERAFDCIVVDMRHPDDGSPLNVVAIATLREFGHLAVLTTPENADEFRKMQGVDTVLVEPIEPIEIIKTIVWSAPMPPEEDGQSSSSSEHTAQLEKNAVERKSVIVRVEDEAKAEEPVESASAEVEEQVSEPEVVEPAKAEVVAQEPSATIEEEDKEASESKVTKGFESSLSKIQDADQQVWQRFVPLANFVYKKLAIIVLTALFLTFVTYGAMIVFFMTSSSWSMPFELSRGHVLVEKAERDLSSMRLRRNQVRQDLTTAKVDLANATRAKRDGELQLALTTRTVDEEIILKSQQRFEILEHITRLKQVIQDFNEANGKGGFATSLENAYAKRLITRRALNSGTLAVLETLHRIATVEGEISLKQLELAKADRSLEFLRSLREEINQPEIRIITSAGSELAHLAREVIDAKTLIASSEVTINAAEKRSERLENSLEVISTNIASLEATPAARALEAPVMVLFVPYSNTEIFAQGEPLYGCGMSIIWCAQTGVVGKPIDGETVSVHPLFGKPMRGNFVEAEFDNPRSVTEELMHAGSAPLWF